MVEIRHKKYSGVSSARQKRADREIYASCKCKTFFLMTRQDLNRTHIPMILLLSSLLPQCSFRAEIHLDRIPKPTLQKGFQGMIMNLIG